MVVVVSQTADRTHGAIIIIMGEGERMKEAIELLFFISPVITICNYYATHYINLSSVYTR